MNPPDYFLADLPPDAPVTPTLVADACQTLKRNRAQFLAGRTTASLVTLLANVAERWLEDDFHLRKRALADGPQVLGFSRETLARGLDEFFHEITPGHLNALLAQDLGHVEALDRAVPMPAGQGTRRFARATGPEFIAHIAAGNIPNPTLMSLMLGLLTRSAQFVKCARGTSLLPRLFAHSIYEADAKLASCLEIAEWPGGNVTLENVLFAEADCVTATGSDETLASIRRRLPATVRFLGHGHRVSFGFVAGGAQGVFTAKKLAALAATDIVAWNQLGCLSPHVIYIEHDAGVPAEEFAALLAGELQRRELAEPRGNVPVEVAATLASRRAFYAVRAAHSADTRLWHSEDSTAWTVVCEADAKFQASCGHRWICVKPVKDVVDLLHHADAVRGRVSTVGLAAPDDRAERITTELARWGVARVCPLGRMQNPPLTWRHDGRPALGELVTWTDWERD